MSMSLLFAAGAIITFITLWGVVMAAGLYATRRDDHDQEILEIVDLDGRDDRPVSADGERPTIRNIAPHPAT